jgi:hypothetical protein
VEFGAKYLTVDRIHAGGFGGFGLRVWLEESRPRPKVGGREPREKRIFCAAAASPHKTQHARRSPVLLVCRLGSVRGPRIGLISASDALIPMFGLGTVERRFKQLRSHSITFFYLGGTGKVAAFCCV